MLRVMEGKPGTRNVWAPEAYYESDKKRWLLIWSSTVSADMKARDHRIWSATTPDFQTLSEPRIFFDPGFSVIDATLLHAGSKYYLIFKDEREQPPRKIIQLTSGSSWEGPWGEISQPFTEAWNEGPAALKAGNEYLLYFDHYRQPQHYGVIRSKDLKQWTDASKDLAFPPGLRHGSFLAITSEEAARLRKAQK